MEKMQQIKMPNGEIYEFEGGYQKPDTGIPMSDLASDVKQKIDNPSVDGKEIKPSKIVVENLSEPNEKVTITNSEISISENTQNGLILQHDSIITREEGRVNTFYFPEQEGILVERGEVSTQIAMLGQDIAKKYTKPSTGIPKSDLAESVQSSLTKVDSAYTKPIGGIPITDMENKAQTAFTEVLGGKNLFDAETFCQYNSEYYEYVPSSKKIKVIKQDRREEDIKNVPYTITLSAGTYQVIGLENDFAAYDKVSDTMYFSSSRIMTLNVETMMKLAFQFYQARIGDILEPVLHRTSDTITKYETYQPNLYGMSDKLDVIKSVDIDQNTVKNKSQAVQSLHIESGKIKPTAMIGNTTQVIDKIDDNNGIFVEVINNHTDQILGNAERCNDLNDKIDQEVSQLNDDLVQTNEVVSQLNENLSDLDERTEFATYHNAGSHNCIYRGKFIGNTLTDEQKTAINNGTFEDIYIGDYWTIGGVNYRVASFDYWLHSGDTDLATHHVVIVPDTSLYNANMNDTNIATGAYVGSKMYAENLEQAKTIINNAFGESHILSHREFLANAIIATSDPTYESAGSWYNSTVELMNERMVYGADIFHNIEASGVIPTNHTVDKSQLSLFVLEPSRINNRAHWWLRDVVSAKKFARVYNNSAPHHADASGSYGVRPVFGITG